MKKLRLALDWTPNVNHIGFFIAKDHGFYTDEQIDIEILNPKEDNYAVTPGKKVELGSADLAIAPLETVISFNNKANKVHLVAIYAVLQEDLSSIASLKSTHLSSPKHLDTKVYASYKARYEDHIVRQMVKNDGGRGDFKITYPEKLGIWNTLLKGDADATWIFDNWEGVEAETQNIALNKFRMKDFGIPYCYSPIVLVKQEAINADKSAYVQFIKATRKGFLYAAEHPAEALEVLKKYVTAEDLQNIDLEKTLESTLPYIGDEETCGRMLPERIQQFLNWIVEHQLENEGILQQHLYTNELIETVK